CPMSYCAPEGACIPVAVTGKGVGSCPVVGVRRSVAESYGRRGSPRRRTSSPPTQRGWSHTGGPVRILVTTDDGVRAPGIAALALVAASTGHDVVVVAPLIDYSGSGAAV